MLLAPSSVGLAGVTAEFHNGSMPTRSSETHTWSDEWRAGTSATFVVLSIFAFVAELCMLAGLGWVGWSVGTNLAVSLGMMLLLPLSAAVIWGVWCAPKSTARLATPQRWVLKITLFAATFLLLLAFGPMPGAAVLGVATWFLFLISLPADRSAAQWPTRRD